MLDTYKANTGLDPDEFDSARDDSGHGTHTASTSAGNAGVRASLYGSPVATISGIAPRAQIIAYKALGNLGGYSSDLAASIDQAVEDGVDVINYSIGGGARGPGADDIAFLFAADAGVFVATSAGNSGPGAGTVGNPATMPWVTSVGASTQSRFYEGEITLGNGKHFTGASLTPGLGWKPLVDAATAGDELCTPGALEPAVVTGKIVLCKRGVVGRIEKSLAVFQAGGVGMIQYNASDVDNLFTDTHWVPSVHIDYTPGLAIKSYIASAANPRARFETKTPSGKPKFGKWHHAPTMTIFSSRGPNTVAPDVIKPDVTAPGLQILAGGSPSIPTRARFPVNCSRRIAGTSVESPRGGRLRPAQAGPPRSALRDGHQAALVTTASQDVRDNDRVSKADPFDMGAGHIEPGGKWGKGSMTQPGLVYDAGLFEYAGNFTCGMEWGIFSLGSCGYLDSIGVPTDPVDLNLPSIGISAVVGSQTITRTVTSVTTGTRKVTYKAKVEAPRGFKVTVSPATLKLAGGESATFSVTVTNVSAPVGTWRFGALTWKADDYSVRSPIAVRGALFYAPAEIFGTGASGSANFDVKFGYTGSYTAGAHGLVQATVTHDNVLQDADGNFDPVGDAVAGSVNLHQFTLAGASLFRIAMPPEATEANADLDIYVVGRTAQRRPAPLVAPTS